MIKAVIFDVDGVLINSFDANLKFYQDLMILAGYEPPSREMFSKLFHRTMLDVIKILTNSKDDNEINRIWLMGKNRDTPYPNELLTAPKGYESVIKELSKKYDLAIVTSRIKGGVFSLPLLSKVQKYFKEAVYFEDTEKHKPDPEPLLLALKNLGVNASKAVYVGDAESDVQASKAAGMKVIVFPKNEIPDVDATVQTFLELPKVIKSLN